MEEEEKGVEEGDEEEEREEEGDAEEKESDEGDEQEEEEEEKERDAEEEEEEEREEGGDEEEEEEIELSSRVKREPWHLFNILKNSFRKHGKGLLLLLHYYLLDRNFHYC